MAAAPSGIANPGSDWASAGTVGAVGTAERLCHTDHLYYGSLIRIRYSTAEASLQQCSLYNYEKSPQTVAGRV